MAEISNFMSRYLPEIKTPINVNEMIDGDRMASKMKESIGFTFVSRTDLKLIRGVTCSLPGLIFDVRCLDSFCCKLLLL